VSERRREAFLQALAGGPLFTAACDIGVPADLLSHPGRAVSLATPLANPGALGGKGG